MPTVMPSVKCRLDFMRPISAADYETLPVGAGETKATKNYQRQGGRAKDERCMPWLPLRGVATLLRRVGWYAVKVARRNTNQWCWDKANAVTVALSQMPCWRILFRASGIETS